MLARCFARVHCPACGRDILVAFSCKGRGFCPCCGGRRTAETAAHLVDRVLPDVPARQWVLPFTWRPRFLLACAPAPCRAVRRLFLRAVFRWQERRAAHRPKVEVTLRALGPGLEVDPVTGEPWSGVGRFVYDDSRRVEYPSSA